MAGGHVVTLKDVAARAGVSIRTVSNVVNDWPYVRPALRAHVQAVIDELGYQPNLAARNLRAGRTGLIALIVPEIDAPYFAELARFVVDEFSARGMTVVIEQTDGDLERERELVSRGPRSMLFDGLIFSPVAMSSEEVATRQSRAPLVLIGEQHDESEADHVLIDNVSAARDATRHLLGLGRRRIALVGRQRSASRTSELRVAGYREALAEAGIAADDRFAPLADRFSRAEGARLVQELMALPDPPDALFCLTDLLALGALRHLNRSGVSVPDDVAILGFDDIEEGRYATPSLSSVAPDKAAIAREAAALLLERLEGGEERPRVTYVEYVIRERETTGGLDDTLSTAD